MSGPRDRIAAAALKCFALKGYASTTIADIEQAAGLSPGAGGTYRHFKSKQEILEAVIEHALAQSDATLAPQPSTLTDAARSALGQLDQQRDLMALMLRDLAAFPELQRRVVQRLVTGPIRVVAERTAAMAPNVDSEAMAMLLVGALVNVKVLEMLGGRRSVKVSEQRLAAAWAHLYRAAVASESVA